MIYFNILQFSMGMEAVPGLSENFTEFRSEDLAGVGITHRSKILFNKIR